MLSDFRLSGKPHCGTFRPLSSYALASRHLRDLRLMLPSCRPAAASVLSRVSATDGGGFRRIFDFECHGATGCFTPVLCALRGLVPLQSHVVVKPVTAINEATGGASCVSRGPAHRNASHPTVPLAVVFELAGLVPRNPAALLVFPGRTQIRFLESRVLSLQGFFRTPTRLSSTDQPSQGIPYYVVHRCHVVKTGPLRYPWYRMLWG